MYKYRKGLVSSLRNNVSIPIGLKDYAVGRPIGTICNYYFRNKF
jgi:hypothetical protein